MFFNTFYYINTGPIFLYYHLDLGKYNLTKNHLIIKKKKVPS